MNLKSLSYYFLNKLVLSKRSGSLIRRISILSFCTITLSLTSFFIVLFVMNGMNRNIRSRIVTLEPHLTTENSSNINAQVQELVDSGVTEVVQYEKLDLILRTIEGQFRGAEALGYKEQGLNIWLDKLRNLKSKGDSSYLHDSSLYSLNLGKNEVAIGVDLARSLSLLEGDEITLIPPETLLLSSLDTPVFQKVIVKRIITTDLYGADAKLLLFNSDFSLKSFKKTLSYKTGLQFWFKSVIDADSYKNILSKNSIKSETWQEKNSDLFFALKMEKLMIGTFLGLAGLVASTSILTVLSLLMSQKKRDIAVIKTLGFSQNNTLWLFTKIGLWISGGGVILGALLGISTSLYIQKYPVNILPNIYYDSSIPAQVDFYFAFLVLVFAFLLAFLGAYLPARATLQIQPAILLKQKN